MSGIGDMSGDVFGNGMLLSEHIKLVAAFDHRHLIIDPDPDPAAELGGAEAAVRAAALQLGRLRHVAGLRRVAACSRGRSSRSPSPRRCVLRSASPPGVAELSPAELISACLRAPVGLLWNGGIGTYVKATAESHAQVGRQGQRRAPGQRLRGAGPPVGEGGNLGLTQLGRIEYAMQGGESGRAADQHRLHRQLRRCRHLRPRGEHQDPAGRRGGGRPARPVPIATTCWPR